MTKSQQIKELLNKLLANQKQMQKASPFSEQRKNKFARATEGKSPLGS